MLRTDFIKTVANEMAHMAAHDAAGDEARREVRAVVPTEHMWESARLLDAREVARPHEGLQPGRVQPGRGRKQRAGHQLAAQLAPDAVGRGQSRSRRDTHAYDTHSKGRIAHARARRALASQRLEQLELRRREEVESIWRAAAVRNTIFAARRKQGLLPVERRQRLQRVA